MKKLLLLCCVIPLFAILGSCPNPVDDPGETGGTAISIGFGSGGLVIVREDGSNALEGQNLIWKDQDPSRLSLQVNSGAWTDIAWYIDGAAAPAGTGTSITLEAFRYRETAHTLTFRALYNGAPQAATIPFTVTAHRAADIVWTQTENDTSFTDFDLASWEGWGDSHETWELSVVEQPLVYFAVHKRPGQTITTGGTHGAQVTKAVLGATVDGSQASEILDIFTVDTGDTLFAGGSRNFTLAVREPGKTENKIVTVNIRVRPRLTGIALFYVENERLTRITPENAVTYANSYYASHKEAGSFPDWGINFADVTNLATAIVWLNNYAKGGNENFWTEYLVRVEKDEALVKTAIHCYGGMAFPALAADYVRIRIRGYGGERLLTHDPKSTDNPLFNKGSGSELKYLTMGWGFLNVGLYNWGGSGTTGLTHIALHLEENITIDAGGGTDQYFPSPEGPDIRSMVSVAGNCSFVMEPGSRLVNYNGGSHSNVARFCAVLVYNNGCFEMNGGELADIDGRIVCLQTDAARFIYRDGTFTNNKTNSILVGNLSKNYDDPAFRPQD